MTDKFAPAAVSGINVTGLASTPYNVAVGGTDCADGFFGTNFTYWSATNRPDYSSALSHNIWVFANALRLPSADHPIYNSRLPCL